MNRRAIVFVCVENSCRSQVAEAFGQMHRGEDFEIYSAGSNPSGQVNPKAVATMLERDYDLTQHRSESLTDLPQVPFAAAITMGCGDECPQLQAKLREDWGIPDPKHLDAHGFAEVRDDIEARVLALLTRLRKGSA